MKKSILLSLLALTLITYSSSLFNGFIGDDEVVIVKNAFYETLSNVPLIFSSSYLTHSEDLFHHTNKFFHSGSVAYRPVLSLTFFADRFVWGLKPFGYHLTNLFIHLMNVLLVYFLAIELTKSTAVSWLCAALFGVHPVGVEAVCSVGYRGDVLSAFLMLGSILMYLYSRKKEGAGHAVFFLSHVFYFLALFAKEVSIIVPVILFTHDFLLGDLKGKGFIKKAAARYAGYFAVTFFYLYVYFIVFPNTSLKEIGLIGGNLKVHILTMLWVFATYVLDLCNPAGVRIIPPQFVPKLYPGLWAKALVSSAVILIIASVIVRNLKRNKPLSFGLLWFLIALVPVANIIPIVNPMAHRFVYFPMIGFFIAAGYLIEWTTQFLERKTSNPNYARILRISIVLLCVVMTFPLSCLWQSNFSVASSVIDNYPEEEKGYTILSFAYMHAGRCDLALEPLAKSISLGTRDPRVYYMMGYCARDPQMTEESFLKAAALFPAYSSAHLGLGRLYIFQGKIEQAVDELKKSVTISPSYTGYGYLMQGYLMTQRDADALDALNAAKVHLTDESHLRSLNKLYDERMTLTLPIDLGI